jgi:molecular chaperone GrpE
LSEDDPFDGSETPEPPEAVDVLPADDSPSLAPLEATLEPLPDPVPEPAPDAGPAEEFHRRARLAEDRLAEVLTAYRQVRTENDGFRERITRNIERRFDQRRERLLLKFIDILDNLDRALEAAEQTYAGNPLIQGLILVRTTLMQTLQDEGLERIPVLGMPYDPNFSEAVQTQPVEDPDHHHVVVKEVLRGYRLSGKVARASRVVVGEYGQPAPPPAAPAEPEPFIGANETAAEEGSSDDEASADELGLEPETGADSEPVADGPEPSLEELIAQAAASEPEESQASVLTTLEEVEPEAGLAELSEVEPDLLDPLADADDTPEEPALLSEEDFALEPVEDEEPAPEKPRK